MREISTPTVMCGLGGVFLKICGAYTSAARLNHASTCNKRLFVHGSAQPCTQNTGRVLDDIYGYDTLNCRCDAQLSIATAHASCGAQSGARLVAAFRSRARPRPTGHAFRAHAHTASTVRCAEMHNYFVIYSIHLPLRYDRPPTAMRIVHTHTHTP